MRKTLFLMVAFVLSGCSTVAPYTSNKKFDSTFIGPLEKQNISYQGVFRNPIIMIHGFLGSNLKSKSNGENVWGKFKGLDGAYTSLEKLRSLALPMELNKALSAIPDNAVPSGTLDAIKIRILGITFTFNAYRNLVDVLQFAGYQAENQPFKQNLNYATLFQFSYDWRKDLAWNAKKLHEFLLEKRKYIQDQYKILYGINDYNVQFDFVCHSMGGLLGRYYLRFGSADLPKENEKVNITWAGSKYIDRLIILGTPNAGYLNTFIELLNGTDLPRLSTTVLGTWTTYYQMLPAPSRHSIVYADSPDKDVDVFDVKVWKRMKWGLADPKQDDVLKVLLPNVKTAAERRSVAIDHLGKCLKRAKRFIKLMSVKAVPPPDIQLYLVSGNALKTTRRAYIDAKNGKITKIEYASGDGVVTRSSAIYDLRAGGQWRPFFSSPIHWRGMIQLRAAHMGLTTDPAFKDNIIFLLNASPTPSQKAKLDKSNTIKGFLK
ncbi:MAG: hypothetical protein KAG97_09670 [Victivallales bacterium]|nr:hypothetical protein [Victivallales bacterium]